MFKVEREKVRAHQEALQEKYSIDKLDLLMVPGAVFEFNLKRAVWQSPPFIKHYPANHVSGEVRAASSALLYHLRPELTPRILVTGGSDKHPLFPNVVVSRTNNLMGLMRDVYGIPEDIMTPIGNPKHSNTKGNMVDTAAYLANNMDLLPDTGRRIGVLLPRFQAMRMREMYQHDSFFKDNDIEVIWLLAERVVELCDPSFKINYSDQVYSHPAALYCAEREREGRRMMKREGEGEKAAYQPPRPEDSPVYDVDFDPDNEKYTRVIRRSVYQTLGLPNPF